MRFSRTQLAGIVAVITTVAYGAYRFRSGSEQADSGSGGTAANASAD